MIKIMAEDFSAEYAAFTPPSASPEYFTYMDKAGHRMRKLDAAFRSDAFRALAENWIKWSEAHDQAITEQSPRSEDLKGFLSMIERMRDQLTDQIVESALEQQKAADKAHKTLGQ